MLAAASGILAADVWCLCSPTWFWLLFGSIGLLAFCRPRLKTTYLVVAFGFFLLHNLQIAGTPGLLLAGKLGDSPRAITALGCVIDEPKRAAGGLASFLFKLESLESGGTVQPSHATLLVRWRGDPQFGDKLSLFGIAEPIPGPRNPGEFDMRSYLERIDVRQQLLVRYVEDGTLICHHAGSSLLSAAQTSRAWLQRVLCRSLDDSPDVKNFISGIALGLRHQTPEDIEEPFQQTGTLHLFAVAGLHVGIVASLLWIIATVLQFPRKWAAAIIIPLLLFYAAITGLHVSSVRAALMSSILLGGLFFERRVFAFNSLAAAAFLLLGWNTNELFATGFQLSFAVVATIILSADWLSGFLKRSTAPDPFLPRSLLGPLRRLVTVLSDWVFRGSSVSLAAWLGSLLLVLWYFHLLTPISLLANLVVVPMAFFVLAIALLSILSAPIGWLSAVFNNANWLVAQIVLASVHWFAQLPGSHYYIGSHQLFERTPYRITVLDLGAGGAVHVHASGVDWLFDCGSEHDYNRILREYLHSAGVNHLQGLLLSHGDSLHIGGTGSLVHDFSPRILIDNPAPDRSIVHRRLLRDFREQGIQPLALTAGAVFNLSPDASAAILFPPRQFAATTADDEAFVVQLSMPSGKILFTSDSGYTTENALLASGVDLRSDILVKGQHRSGKSGGESFVDAVRPRLIVATSRDFPASERIDDSWAERLRARGIKLFRQDETGAVEIAFDQHGWTARAYANSEIFRSDNR